MRKALTAYTDNLLWGGGGERKNQGKALRKKSLVPNLSLSKFA